MSVGKYCATDGLGNAELNTLSCFGDHRGGGGRWCHVPVWTRGVVDQNRVCRGDDQGSWDDRSGSSIGNQESGFNDFGRSSKASASLSGHECGRDVEVGRIDA